MDFKKKIASVLAELVPLKSQEIEPMITVPPNPALGDYAFPCFKLGSNPHQEALRLKDKLKSAAFLQKTDVIGPYLNFFINKSILAEEVLAAIKKAKTK